jgi:preprotein translocase SecE subunit
VAADELPGLPGSGEHQLEVHRENPIGRLIGFLKGSWRELQRVQWPDRRQVMQATGVVIGFVIIAGAFLGLASFGAQKLVNLILYGHG